MTHQSIPSKRIIAPMDRHERTMTAMLQLYCQAHHESGETLCEDCLGLQQYALARFAHCPFGDQKPVCSKCKIHCYKPDMQQRIREVMGFAGPRMILRHPGLALAHLADKRKPAPNLPRKVGRRPTDPAS